MNGDITESVVETAKRIENYDSIHDIDPLEVKVECSIDHELRSITLVLSTGGPHIEVDVTNGTVSGYWGSDSHTTHVANDELLTELHRYYEQRFDDMR